MEKPDKLRRYERKDYTQVVEFPVEIVGRDGVVRRYSFEASIRLYQRRIASASVRYDDQAMVDAEVEHCRRRIEQLRASYLQRYGGAVLAAACGDLGGELVALLRRFYGAEGRLVDLQVQGLSGPLESPQVFFAWRQGVEAGHLLYLYRFGTSGEREAFFSHLRSLRVNRAIDAEKLVALHHTADCGLLLAGGGPASELEPWPGNALPEDLLPRPVDDEGTEEPAVVDDLLQEGSRLLEAGSLEAARHRFDAASSASPYQRAAWVGQCLAGELLGRPQDVEMAARAGLHHLPGDPVLRYHLGVARLRQADLAEARELLQASLRGSEVRFPALAQLCLVELADGRWTRAFAVLQRALRAARPMDGEAVSELERVRRPLGAWLSGALLSGVSGLAGAALLAMTPGLASVLVAVSGLAGLATVAVRPRVTALVADCVRRLVVLPPESPVVPEVR